MGSSPGSWMLCALLLGCILPRSVPAGESLGGVAADLVGRRGDPSRLEVHGCEEFSAERVASALKNRPRFWLVAHPRALLDEYLSYLESEIRLGYLAAGYRDVEVDAAADRQSGRIVVTVEEGPLYHAGPILVEGKGRPLGEAIREALVRPRTSPASRPAGNSGGEDLPERDPCWREGGPARLDPEAREEILGVAAEVYLEAGFLFTQLEASLGDPQPDRSIPLHIRILDEGTKPTLRRVEFEGRFSDAPREIRELLGIEENMALDWKKVQEMHERANDLGRYQKAEVLALRCDEPDRADLLVRLFQAEFADAREPRVPEERRVLRKAFEWLSDPAGWDGCVTLKWKLPAEDSSRGLAIARGTTVEFAAGHGGYELIIHPPPDSPFAGDLSLLCLEDRMLASSPAWDLYSTGDGIRVPSAILGLKHVVPDPETSPFREMGSQFTVGLGTATIYRSGLVLTGLSPPPLVLSYLLAEKWHCTLDERAMRVDYVRQGEPEVPVADVDRETGRVRFLIRLPAPGDGELIVETESVGLRDRLEGRLARAEAEEYTRVPAARFLLRVFSELAPILWRSLDGQSPIPQQAVRALLLKTTQPGGPLEKEVATLLGRWPRRRPDEDKPIFRLWRDPAEFRAISMSWGSLGMVLSRWSVFLPPDSWPRTLLRETALYMLGQPRYISQELEKLYNTAEAGPLGYWATAELLSLAGQVRASRRFARTARLEARFFGLRDEIALLRKLGTLGPALLAGLGHAARELGPDWARQVDDSAESTASLSAEKVSRLLEEARRADDPKEAGALVLEMVWEAGLRDALLARLAELESQPLRTAPRMANGFMPLPLTAPW